MHKIFFFFLMIVTTVATANDYTLTITDAAHHLAEVEVVFTDVKTKTFKVKLPVWRSGKYKILDLAKNIRNFKTLDAQDKELTWHKTDKNTWEIFVNTPNIVKVKYQIYANQLRDRVSHIDATHAFLDASGVFVYNQSSRDKALTVKLNVPAAWQSVSGMQSIGKHQFKADNYDQLVDSPIESGLHQFDSIQVDAQTYEIVIWGTGNYDMQQLKDDIEKLHYQAQALWKKFPFKRYVYMYHVGNNLRGATEHLNSTIIQTDRFGFYPEKKYRKIIATTAHEFVHTWNVKAYRPSGISPYDYNYENYSDLFWLVEGKTSYYDNLFNVRAEIYSLKDYFETLAKDINKFRHKPGRKVMSLSESSFDTWLGNNQNRSHNSAVSIYLKGSLVAWLLDKEIRLATNNKKSLDDLSLKLYEKFANDKHGYSSFDVKQLLKEITGKDFQTFWSDYVDGTKEINFDELLEFYGLKIKPAKAKDKNKAAFGWQTKLVNGLQQVTVVDDGGAAWQGGITTDDIILAINDVQVGKNLTTINENLKIDKSYMVHYFNQAQLKTTTIVAEKAAPKKIEIIPISKPSKKQKKHFENWLKHDWIKSFKSE